MGKKKKSKRLPNIGKEELAIFQFVQENAPVTVRQAADHFADLGKARTTVLTVMERLREKGLLEREKTAGAFRYRTAVESTTVINSLVGDFVQQVLGGSFAPFMAYMSEASELSHEDLQELKKIVHELDAKNRKSRRGKSK
jgi:predicted transcriptional regulator